MKFDSEQFTANLDVLLFVNELSLKDLAKEINVPYSTFYYQYKHPSALSTETLDKIANYFGTTVDSLTSGSYALPSGVSGDDISDFMKNGWSTHPKMSVPTNFYGELTIPFVPQKISAGYGEEILNPDDVEIQTINIMQDLARGVPRESLLAARVKGDSMIDVYIYPDDIVVFANGIISGDGIYVLSIDNEVMVKRLVFDRLNHSVLIISENKKYPQREAKDDNQSLRILGKVVGWIHANSV